MYVNLEKKKEIGVILKVQIFLFLVLPSSLVGQ